MRKNLMIDDYEKKFLNRYTAVILVAKLGREIARQQREGKADESTAGSSQSLPSEKPLQIALRDLLEKDNIVRIVEKKKEKEEKSE